MSNVYDIDRKRRHAEQRAVEASAWIAKLDRRLDDAEADALRAWMRADARNRAELLEMARMWDQMDALARLSELFPRAADASPAAPRRGRHRMARYRIAIAAAGALVLAGLATIPTITDPSETATAPDLDFDVAAHETGIGSVSTIELSDRSAITLNTNSRAVVRFAQRQRVVTLERGELHIDVAHDPTRPLSVIAGRHVVQAVGTAFSVRLDASQAVEVLVVDGRVRVHVEKQGPASPGAVEPRSFLLAEGERVVLNADSEVVETLAADEVEVELSWRNGHLIFRGESLAAAVAEVGRYTTARFVIVDEDLRQVRVAGLFKRGDVAGFLSTLEANFDIVHARVGDETILLSARESSGGTGSPSLPASAAAAR